ncbi:uncharacterized protein N7506_009409 [Penicillium brevicompactum]|uniref:uncharacterized protein n=1 Tax=Penicillium brevicompactum TaxID=5074 RepID=UPI002540157E|nr:uncharacterized protein N7506_009409 [Penicillium brevicompactum]KAJ5326307.1 hypothetical protein N7506_009409 [Penicillium brevicompactum]
MASPVEVTASPLPSEQPSTSPPEITASKAYRPITPLSAAELDIWHSDPSDCDDDDDEMSDGTKGKTPLMYAVESGDRELVARLLEEGADVDATNCLGESAIFYAVHHLHFKDIDIVSEILARSPKLNIRNKFGQTVIDMAANTSLVVKLSEAGADIEFLNAHGGTLISDAIAAENWMRALTLVTRGANPRYENLPAAALRDFRVHGYRGVPADGLEALSLTRNQSNVDPAEPPDHVAELERSLTGLDPSLEIEKLHESSPLGHASDKSMLDSGSKRSPFDPDPSLDAGNTSQTEASDNAAKKIPHLCAFLDAPLTVKLLEHLKTPEEIPLESIFYPEVFSTEWSGPRCYKLLQSLIRGGYTPNDPQARYSIPNLLCGAALSCDEKAFKVLLENDADLYLKDWAGRLPAHFAAGNANYDILPMILSEAPSTLTALDSTMRTPLHFAAQFGNKEAVKLILNQCVSAEERRQQVNQPDLDGWTPICWAIRESSHPFSDPNRYMATLLTLIENGADLLVRFSRGSESQEFVNTPWHLARLYSAPDEIVSLIHDTVSRVAPDEIQSKSWSQQIMPYILQPYYCFNCLAVSHWTSQMSP